MSGQQDDGWVLPESLDGQAALVTGASSGIGRETARKLARAGANVALAARSEEKLTDLRDEIESAHDIDALVIPTNVRDRDAVEELVERTVDEFGGLDVVVSNAGAGAPGTRVGDIPIEEYRKLMETNVDGTFFVTQAAMPHLRDSGGTIVFLGSLAGQYPRPATPLYAATKWWIRGWALSVQAMVGPDGVGVTVVNPAETRTDIEVLGESLTDQFNPGEVTEPSEVASAIVFAAGQSPRSTVSELDLYYRDKLSGF
jgi:NADP-dependent 3-hydroxy acid dehydrogenase YdfG